MSALKIRVENGRIKLDAPTNLPNGTELYVVPVDELEDVVLAQDDGLDDEERQELLRSIDEGLADVDAGDVHDFKAVIDEQQAVVHVVSVWGARRERGPKL